MKILGLVIIFLSLQAVFAREERKVEAFLGLRGTYVDDLQVEARVFGLYGALTVEQPIIPDLKAVFDLGVTIETGSSSTVIADSNEFAPDRQWVLRDGFLSWTPSAFFEFKAGAISQQEFSSPLLLSSTAFLAATEKLKFNFNDSYSFYLKAQQSIPNNQNLADRIGVVDEGTPSFFIETIGLNLDGDLASIKFEASQFSYNRLSTDVAFRSQFFGNSVSPNGQQNAQFVYQFQGYNFYAESEVYFTDTFLAQVSLQYLYNEEAPEGRNLGRLLHIGMGVQESVLFVEFFSNESDSSPAFYNSKRYGHNNKEGIVLGISGELNPEGLLYNLAYHDLSLIRDENLFQANTKAVFFNLEKEISF